jgi:cytochrome c oxidase subunit 3
VIAAESQSAKLGLWLFLAADSMFFLGLIGAILVLRSGQPENFAAGAMNKFVAAQQASWLVVGSLMMFTAAMSARHEKRFGLIVGLACSLLAAIIFLLVVTPHVEHPTLPMDAFHACYFTLWAAHTVNIIAAMIAVLILLAQAIRGKILPAQTQHVATYWHFIVFLWILLFPILFLAGT